MTRASLALTESAAKEADVAEEGEEEGEGEGWILDRRWRIMCWKETV